MGEGWGQAVASSDLCPSEYLIHLHYLLVWFNMACIMKRSTATSNMPPDSSPKEAVCTCRRIVGSYTKTERTLSLPISFYRSCSFGSTSRLQLIFHFRNQITVRASIWWRCLGVNWIRQWSNGYKQSCHPIRVRVIRFVQWVLTFMATVSLKLNTFFLEIH